MDNFKSERSAFVLFFFFNDTATTEIYTLSLHDALPIWASTWRRAIASNSSSAWPAPTATHVSGESAIRVGIDVSTSRDRKSTRLNSSHANISYAVFCLKKKKLQHTHITCSILLLYHTLL